MRSSVISEKFFSSVLPLDNEITNTKNENGEIDQSFLLSSTFHHSQYGRYPPSVKFCKLFIRKLITLIEGCGEEVDENLYNIFLSFVSTPSDQDGFSYKSYSIKNYLEDDDWLVLKVSSNMISNGTTGLLAWQAAYFMSEWVLSEKKLFENKSVLELGSGTGLLGLVVSKLCKVEEFLFTDHHGEVLKMLEENISINGWMHHNGDNEIHSLDEDEYTKTFLPSNENLPNCKVITLDWELVSDEMLGDVADNLDVLVASDVVFDTRIIPSLVRVIKKLLQPSPSSSSSPPSSPSLMTTKCKTGYICGAIRNRDTWNCFIETCGENSLNVEIISFDPPSEQRRLFKFINHSLDFQIVKLTSF